MKIIDFFASDMSDQNSLLPTELFLPKEFKHLLRNTNISIEISSSDFAIFSNSTNCRLIITIQTKFIISAYKTVVFIELRFPAEVLQQTVTFVQKKN